DLLALWNSYILSPTSTPEDDFIDIGTGKLVGTGPFIFDSCELNYKGESLKTEIHANPDYWGGAPKINKVTFLALSEIEIKERMLSGELSYAMGSRNDETLDIFRNTPGITVVPKTRLIFFYIGMNNNKINLTMRKAISYAFNYTHCIEGNWGIHAERARSPLPRKLRYSNWNFEVPDYNITRARQILINANWSGTTGLTANNNISAGNEWETLANSITPLGEYNFSTCWPWMEFIANLTIGYLKQIGVKVNLNTMGSLEMEYKLYDKELDMFTLGWGIASVDPIDIINPLYSSKLDGVANFINFNDTEVQLWIDHALEEFNETAREQLYFNIQQRLIEELYPALWLAFPISYDIWDSDVKGIPIDGAPLRLILKFAYLDK
ncbi:MAG: ABC transporter substrate-binding protein, partial [Candidatus Hermodarchaeota archaeon]